MSTYAGFLAELNSSKFRILRPGQQSVLDAYTSGFEDVPDVAIELPTGAGKTLIALLIAEHKRRLQQKVAILSANKTLASQMHQECQELGIPADLMQGPGFQISSPVKRRYHRARSVAIMNYWVYFNQNPVIDPADFLVMDDAHLAEHCLHSLYSVEINRLAHNSLFDLLISELYHKFPEYSVLADGLDPNSHSTRPPELLSFIDQTTVCERIAKIIDNSTILKSDKDLKFRWDRLRDKLNQANIYLARDSIWIRPYIYPLISNSHYSTPSQRLYMSATIGDPGDLARRLGVKPIKTIPIPQEHSESTFGRRLLLMNRLDEGDIPDRLGAAILAALRIHPKSVWLCSSTHLAVKYQELVMNWLKEHQLTGHPSWVLTPEGDEIQEFKRAQAGHLFVAGRFDGMDFNGDECRLIVLTTLPRAINTQEEFISAYLRDSGFMRQRLNQRVVQALGRCNRDDADYAIYALADRRFATYFGLESNKAYLPANIVAELDMGQDSAELDASSLCTRVTEFLSGQFSEYDALFDTYLSDVPRQPIQSHNTDTSADEIVGWASMFGSQNFAIAQRRFQKCWDAAKRDNLIELGALHGWHWAKALYLQGLQGDTSASNKAIDVLDTAIQRGGRSAWFNRMRSSLNRARNTPNEPGTSFDDDYFLEIIRAFDELLDQYGSIGPRFEQYCNGITEQLYSNSHNAFALGLKGIGTLLGYDADCPKDQGAPDCIWKGTFGNSREIVTYEAKIEHSPSNRISLSDSGQANNQKNKALSDYQPFGFSVSGAIVTHMTELGENVEESLGEIRIVSRQAMCDLWRKPKMPSFFTEIGGCVIISCQM